MRREKEKENQIVPQGLGLTTSYASGHIFNTTPRGTFYEKMMIFYLNPFPQNVLQHALFKLIKPYKT